MGQTPTQTDDPMFLPVRPNETQEETRLRETLNGHALKMLAAIDGACRLRSSPRDTKIYRAHAKNAVKDACSNGMLAFYASKTGGGNG